MVINKNVTPLILAGGFGTRLKSVMVELPKVLAPINKRPFLSYLLDQLIATGFRYVVLCTGYMGDRIRDTFGNTYRSLAIQYSQEQEPLGTGGSLRQALPLVPSETILAMNGDSYVDVDLLEYFLWYIKMASQASLLLTHVSDVSCYGQVKTDSINRIISFEEKISKGEPGWINAGVYIFKKHQLESIPCGKPVSLEREFLPTLIDRKIHGFKCQGAFIDIGTPNAYANAGNFFKNIMNSSIPNLY